MARTLKPNQLSVQTPTDPLHIAVRNDGGKILGKDLRLSLGLVLEELIDGLNPRNATPCSCLVKEIRVQVSQVVREISKLALRRQNSSTPLCRR